ncbi:PfkB family carbohydrate kinase [Staphylococcus caeli]|uniref:PfkB family carbohydrate kinase n=1 Tax=Staphylococcus caeli TaxID=2201815 RepID=UPI003F56BFF5
MSFITFGELLLRLMPPNYQTFQQAHRFDIQFGGAEANVAIGLSGLGVNTSMITALPNNDLGQTVIQMLKKYDVETRYIQNGEGRLGLYYMEKGIAFRPSQIIYDRDYSLFTKMQYDDFQFEHAFKQHHWFHFTGITPALNDALFDTILQSVRLAKSMGLYVSCDLNFRAMLWDFQTAREKLSLLLPYVDLIFGYEPLSLPDHYGKDKKDGLSRHADEATLKPILQEIHDKYDIAYIAFTQRKNFANSRNRLQGFLSAKNQLVKTGIYESEILDRVGTGDAFSVGVIYGIMKGLSMQDTVNIAVNNMLYKHAVEGDYNYTNIERIKDITEMELDIKR